jgi:hypothetical protein
VRARLVSIAIFALFGAGATEPAADAPAPAPKKREAIADAPRAESIAATGEAPPENPIKKNRWRDEKGAYHAFDYVPFRAGRTEDWEAYRYPVPPLRPGARVAIGFFDLASDDLGRSEPDAPTPGHGGVDLIQSKTWPVALLALEGQEGPAEVLSTDELLGRTVITLHRLRESDGALHDHLVLFGHLDIFAPRVRPGMKLDEGAIVGTVGESGATNVHLHLEVRRVRDGVDPRKYPRIVASRNALSVPCDPRNVLPLR